MSLEFKHVYRSLEKRFQKECFFVLFFFICSVCVCDRESLSESVCTCRRECVLYCIIVLLKCININFINALKMIL